MSFNLSIFLSLCLSIFVLSIFLSFCLQKSFSTLIYFNFNFIPLYQSHCFLLSVLSNIYQFKILSIITSLMKELVQICISLSLSPFHSVFHQNVIFFCSMAPSFNICFLVYVASFFVAVESKCVMNKL